jgi:hypothetical protein
VGRSGGEDRNQREGEVRWCEGRSGTEDRTPLDILVTVEEACAPSISYQVQTRHRHKKIEKRMLIGISIRSVTSKRSCALDDSPSGERVLSRRRERVGKHLKL